MNVSFISSDEEETLVYLIGSCGIIHTENLPPFNTKPVSLDSFSQ